MRCIEIVSILEILRLWELGLTQREIATSVKCGKSTVGDIQQRCRLAGLTFKEAGELTNTAIRARLYPTQKSSTMKEWPEWERIHAWLKSGKKRNLQMAWEDYRLSKRDGLGYSQFCKQYNKWRDATGKAVTMVQNHEPGKEMYIDWMGDTLDCILRRNA